MFNTICADLFFLRTMASYKLLSYAIHDSFEVGYSLLRRRAVQILTLCAVLAFGPAAADAQEPGRMYFGVAVTPVSSGWWSPPANSAYAPHLTINLTQLDAFTHSDLLRTTMSQPTSDIVAELPSIAVNNWQIANLPAGTYPSTPTLLPSPVAPSTTSLIPMMEAKYNAWETDLAETRNPVDVNGASVYPLIQINHGSWHLPIVMYISTVHDNNAW